MPSESVLDLYLDEVRRIRATKAGTGETSYYPAIGLLLNAVGSRLKPRVFCLHHPSGDAGIPDFGLFEQAQFRRDEAPAWTEAVTPERGVEQAARRAAAILLLGPELDASYKDCAAAHE